MSLEAISFEDRNLENCDLTDLHNANAFGTPIEACFSGSLHEPVAFPNLDPGQKLVCDIYSGEGCLASSIIKDLGDMVIHFNSYKYFNYRISWRIIDAVNMCT